MAALDDGPRPGKVPRITPQARAWLASLACQEAKDLGYPHELWTTCLLARHAREHAGPDTPAWQASCLERHDEAFEAKMADVPCVCREVAILRESQEAESNVATISYDEKPDIQAIGTTAPDLPPQPGSHRTFARDHEYKRHGTLGRPAGIDLPTGQVHAGIGDRHRSREFIGFLKKLDAAHPALQQALGPALDSITPQDAHGFFRHAGCGRPMYPRGPL